MRVKINKLLAGNNNIVEQPEVIEIPDSEIVRIGREYFRLACKQVPPLPKVPELHVRTPQAPELQVFAHWEKDELGNTICSNCKGIRRDSRTDHTNFCNRCGACMTGWIAPTREDSINADNK